MLQENTRVLVVDDTVTYRKIVGDVLEQEDGIEVVGVAANGKIALQKIEQLKPDIITLDLEMPEIDGLEVLRRLKATNISVGAIMLSAFTTKGAQATVEALELGAFDFVVKPSADTIQENIIILQHELCPKIKAFSRTKQVRDILTRQPVAHREKPAKQHSPPVNNSSNLVQRMNRIIQDSKGKPEIVVLGISTGGPQALGQMLPKLPADLAAPVLIVQHMPPMFTKSLADDLNKKCPLNVCEAQQDQALHPGNIYIAPGGQQMKISTNMDKTVIQITDDPPENSCRPSVDYLFRSAAQICGGKTLAVIMTGMGNDGTLGCRLLKRQGASIMVQNEQTCVVYGMPKLPTDEGLADTIAPLDKIAQEITHLVGQNALVCK
ncbi:MAG: chemotaxis response regulator protein-glutamate methylesterase [Planctomycetes bacterium]|nr:chemotaxis response regulator protein-glutamate methylesterase [Planctomycetota bacterium]